MAVKLQSYYGTGRRKTSVARVWLYPGQGKSVVNNIPYEEYFPQETFKLLINQPFAVTQTENKFHFYAIISGGGLSGQAQALRHGITRALIDYSPELKSVLKKAGLVRRDPRRKERKKYGKKAARRSFQWTKR